MEKSVTAEFSKGFYFENPHRIALKLTGVPSEIVYHRSEVGRVSGNNKFFFSCESEICPHKVN